MRFRTKDEEKITEVTISTEKRFDGAIDIIGSMRIDGIKRIYKLLSLNTNGKFYRWKGINDKLGFKLDIYGRIIEFDSSVELNKDIDECDECDELNPYPGKTIIRKLNLPTEVSYCVS